MNSSQRGGQKSLIYIIGAVGGVLFGLLSAHLYTQSAEETNAGEQPQLNAGEAVGIVVALLGLVRQISAMGAHTEKRR